MQNSFDAKSPPALQRVMLYSLLIFVATFVSMFVSNTSKSEDFPPTLNELLDHKIRYFAWNVPESFRENMKLADDLELLDHAYFPRNFDDVDLLIFVISGWDKVRNIPGGDNLLASLVENVFENNPQGSSYYTQSEDFAGSPQNPTRFFFFNTSKDIRFENDQSGVCFARLVLIQSVLNLRDFGPEGDFLNC